MRRSSYIGSAGVSGGGSAVLGSIVHAAANPNVTDYVATNGQLIAAASYSVLDTIAWPKVKDLTASTAVGSGSSQRVCLGASGTELFIVGQSTVLHRSTDSGGSFSSAGIALPADASVLAQLGEANLWNRSNGDILWDPVSSTYCLLVGAFGGDGLGTDNAKVQLWSSPDLVTWTHRWAVVAITGSTFFGHYNEWNTVLRLTRDSGGNCWLSSGNGPLYKKASGAAINTSATWTQVDPSGSAVAAGTATRLQYLPNGVFVWWQASLTNGQFYTSPDGTTWSLRTKSSPGNAFGIAAVFGSTYAVLFCGTVGGSQVGSVFTTTDFVTWAQVNIGGLTAFNGLFADVVGFTVWYNTTRKLFQSSNLTTWDEQAAPNSPQKFDSWFLVGTNIYGTSPNNSGSTNVYKFSQATQYRVPTLGSTTSTLVPFFKAK